MEKSKLYFQDNVFGLSGYSKAVRELAFSLSPHLETYINPLDKAVGYLPEQVFKILSSQEPTEQDLVVWRTYFNPFPPKGHLIANIALESTKLPERMVKEANDNRVLQVWSPSEFCHYNYAHSGIIEDKLRVVPHGFNPSIFSVKSTRHKKFIFLFVGGYTGPNDRKGADLLVKAFTQEFKPGEALLYLKINASYGDFSQDLQKRDDIIIDTNNYLDSEMAQVYNKADCYVLPTQGEAFDMSILEAMACGLPVITNTWGGQMDYIQKICSDCDKVGLIASQPATPRYNPWDCGIWMKPTLNSLRKEMRDFFKNPRKKTKYKGIDNWTWAKSGEKALSYLKELRD